MNKVIKTAVLTTETSFSFISFTRELFLYPLVIMDGMGIFDSFSLMRKVNPPIMIQTFIIIFIMGMICKVWEKENTVKNTKKDYVSLASIILASIVFFIGLLRCDLYVGFSIKVIFLLISYFTYFRTIILVQMKIFISVFTKIINIKK